jgi:hypothetical protein
MMTRTRNRVVTFSRPFQLDGMDREQPAGSYAVEIDEEQLDASFAAFRRVSTRIRVPLASGAASSEIVPISPDELDAALARDAESPAPMARDNGP